MKTGTWKVLAVVAAALAAAVAVVAVAMGGCSACIETVAGACVPMKCHWTMRAVVLVEVLAAACLLGLAFVKCKVGRRWLAGTGLLAQALVLAVLYTPLMGLCANDAMPCHQTALACTVLACLVGLACVVAMAQADPHKGSLPRREL